MKTKSLEKIFSVFILLSFISVSSFAQKAPVKYGKIDIADLEMTAYPLDTSAVAAILCDYGYFNSTTYDFVRILRIKIFKKEGSTWGDRVFPTSKETNIRGITYNLENGEVVETKLKSESIFLERVSEDIYRTRVAMPNVREGSVIDLEFRHPWLPSVWRFQEVIPVKWSELNIDESNYITFRKNFFGFVPLSESSFNHWVARDVPAFKTEPYMTNSSNYLTRFEIELLSVAIPPSSTYRGFFKEYSTTWEAVNSRLMQSDHFGMAMQGCLFLNNTAKEIEQKYTTPIDRLIAAHEYVKRAVKWNDLEALYISSDNLSAPYNKKIGNSSDVNLILIQLLKKLEFDVVPVALSTRSNGFLSPVFPSLDKLNYVIACVQIDGKPVLVDATEEYLPVGMLPVRCINLQGRIIDKMNADWVDLIPVKKNKSVVQANLTMGADLVMTGQIIRKNYDYNALDFRNKYAEYNSEEEFLRDFESENPGLSIINSQVSNLDSIYLPVDEMYEVRIKNMVTSAGNMLYINPMLFAQITENPFKSEVRQYPVDFIYPSEMTFMLKISIPEEFEVIEIPKVMVLKLPDNSLSIHYQISNLGNSVQLTYKFNLARPYFSVEEYADLRTFYSELVKKHAEPIVIKMLLP